MGNGLQFTLANMRAGMRKLYEAQHGQQPQKNELPLDDARYEKPPRTEKILMERCTNWLHSLGYWPRYPGFIRGGTPPRGWWIHLNPIATKGNPIILDLIVMTNWANYIEIELKLPGRPFSSFEQELLCMLPGKCKVETYDAFVETIRTWEKEISIEAHLPVKKTRRPRKKSARHKGKKAV